MPSFNHYHPKKSRSYADVLGLGNYRFRLDLKVIIYELITYYKNKAASCLDVHLNRLNYA